MCRNEIVGDIRTLMGSEAHLLPEGGGGGCLCSALTSLELLVVFGVQWLGEGYGGLLVFSSLRILDR